MLIDRVSRKSVLVGADLFRAALVLSLLWPQGVGQAYLVAAGLSAGNVFFGPALNAVIPALTTPAQRLAANSVSWSTGRLVQIVAASRAGALIGLIGTGAAFALNGASFVVSAAFIASLDIPGHAGRDPWPSVHVLDVSWSAMRLLSLGLGALVVDRVGIQPLYWVGGTLLAVAGALGLLLLGRYWFPAEES